MGIPKIDQQSHAPEVASQPTKDAVARVPKLEIMLTSLLDPIGFVICAWQIVYSEVLPIEWWLLGTMFVLTAFAYEAGFHRYFAHNAYRAHTAVRAFMGIFGSMWMGGSVLVWPTIHRLHHRFSDTEKDLHSPLVHNKTVFNGSLWMRFRGFWHSYQSWVYEPIALDFDKNGPDLKSDPLVMWIHKNYRNIWIAGIIIPGLIEASVVHSWAGFFNGMLWGGLGRIFLAKQPGKILQAACHIWGTRPYESGDNSRNNILLVPFTMGMGWHNNHHAFPFTSSNALRWWHIDPSAWILRTLNFFGLVTEMRFPTPEQLAAKKKRHYQNEWPKKTTGKMD